MHDESLMHAKYKVLLSIVDQKESAVLRVDRFGCYAGKLSKDCHMSLSSEDGLIPMIAPKDTILGIPLTVYSYSKVTTGAYLLAKWGQKQPISHNALVSQK